MILPDVNVLIYAFRREVPEHARCHAWLTSIVESESPFALSPLALSGLVRITTTTRAYKDPATATDAFAFCDSLLAQPNCRVIEPGARHWDIFRDLCLAVNARAKLVPDAWFAALSIEHGCEWVTLDRDFARFPGLRWRTPG